MPNTYIAGFSLIITYVIRERSKKSVLKIAFFSSISAHLSLKNHYILWLEPFYAF